MNPLLELCYLPPVSWLALACSGEDFTLEACEHFQKGTYRNRCHIAGPNGLQRLSIPLAGGKNQQMPIREVRIAYDQPWQQVHWRSIQAAYGSAPFFPFYADDLAPFFQKKWLFLFDFNLELLGVLLKKLDWTGRFEWSETYLPPGQTGDLQDFRNAVLPGAKRPQPAWFQPGRYPQVFQERHGFLPDLSALDLLFCQGKAAGDVLRSAFNRAGLLEQQPDQ